MLNFKKNYLFFPLLTCFVIIIFSFLFYKSYYNNLESNFKERIKIQTISLTEKIEERIKDKISVLDRMSKRAEFREEISKEEWKSDAKLYMKHNLGFQGIAWTNNNFTITEAIPFQGNEILLNSNLKDNTIFNKELENVLASQNITLTETIKTKNNQEIFYTLVPVYIKGKLSSIIIGVFNVNNLIKSILKNEILTEYDISLSNNNEIIYSNNVNYKDNYLYTSDINIYNLIWKLELKSDKSSFYEKEEKTLNIIIFSGFFIALYNALLILFLQNIYFQKRELYKAKQDLEKEIDLTTKATKELKESQELYKLITENTNDLICLYDLDRNYKYVSPSIINILGYKENELFSINPLSLLHSDDLENIQKLTTEQLEKQPVEHRLKKKDGSYIWVETIRKSVFDDDGNIIGYQSSSRDISERIIIRNQLLDSRERFQRLSDMATEGIVISDLKEMKVIDANNYFAKLLGYDFHEVIGLGVSDFVSEKSLKEVKNNVIKGYSGIYETVAKKKDGSEFYVEIVGKTINYFGKKARVTSVRDITERKNYEKEIYNIKEQLELVIKASNDGYWDIDLTTNKFYFSDRCKEILGYKKDEIKASYESWEKLIHIEDKEPAINLLNDYIIGKVKKFKQKQRFYHKTGSIVYIMAKAIKVKNSDGRVVRIVGSYTDITKQVKYEKDLNNAKDEAESANKMKSDFLAMMSHEIRTPMNGVIGMTDLLMNTTLTNEQKDFIETIRLSGESLLTIINDILDFSKIESGKMELEDSHFDLRICIEEVFDLLSMKALEKKLDLIYFIDSEVPPQIIADITRIRQILINIINNALKFTEKGEIFVSVELVELKENTSILNFSVRDSGIGISEEKIQTLFKPFTQADSSTTRKYGGTGLGLAICKKLVELMNGKIWIKSKLNKGTTIGFTIEVGISHNQPRIYFKGNLPKLEGLKILIVDDNKTNLKVLEKQTKNWKMKPITSNSSINSLELIKNNNFDLAILDMQMPGLDGFELGKKIRENYSKEKLPLILFSSINQIKTKEMDNVFNKYLHKPIKQSLLFKSILDIVEKIDSKTNDSKAVNDDVKLSSILPLNILLAEDNMVNQKLAKKMLEKLGYSIEIANNGLEVIDLMNQKNYDLIFMDMQMPEMDGLETTKYLKENFIGELPKIIALTANAMIDDRKKCLEAGMDDYLSKPIILDSLQKTIIKWGKTSL